MHGVGSVGSPHFNTFEDASSHVTQVQQVQGISWVYGVYVFRVMPGLDNFDPLLTTLAFGKTRCVHKVKLSGTRC